MSKTEQPAAPAPSVDESVDELAERTRRAKSRVEQLKSAHAYGTASYDELAQAGKEFVEAFYLYQKTKFPHIKPKRPSYMAVIR